MSEKTAAEVPVSDVEVVVLHIPAAVEEDKIKELFKAYEIKAIKVTKARKGRDFHHAFITFPSHEVQEKAIKEMEGKKIDDAEIVVRAARLRKPRAPKSKKSEPRALTDDVVRVKRLPAGTDEAKVKELFMGYEVKAVKFPRSRRESKFCRAFVTLASHEMQEKAVKSVNGVKVGDAEIVVEVAPVLEPKPKNPKKKQTKPKARKPRSSEPRALSEVEVVVLHLPPAVDEDGLKQIFDGFEMKESKVTKVGRNGKFRRAFVTFPSSEVQKKAIEEVNGTKVEDVEIVVKAACERKVRAPADPNETVFIQVPRFTTHEQLKDFLKDFKDYKLYLRSRSFRFPPRCFVTFNTTEEAKKCIDTVNEKKWKFIPGDEKKGKEVEWVVRASFARPRRSKETKAEVKK